MPSEQDKTADRVNLVALAFACGVTLVGFVLAVTIALIWVGIPLMAVGLIWIAGLLISAKTRTGGAASTSGPKP